MLLRMRTITALTARFVVVLVTAVVALQMCSAPLHAQSPRDTLFDFLAGDWRVEAMPRVSKLAAFVHGAPRYTGHWRGRRTDAGVTDEVRVADAAGNTKLVLRFERTYNVSTRTWSVREIDREGSTSARMQPVVANGVITLTAANRIYRSRFVERTPTSFRYLREVSDDGGRTWEEPVLVITAQRTSTSATPSVPR